MQECQRHVFKQQKNKTKTLKKTKKSINEKNQNRSGDNCFSCLFVCPVLDGRRNAGQPTGQRAKISKRVVCKVNQFYISNKMKSENLQKVVSLWFDIEKKVPILELEDGKIYKGKYIEQIGMESKMTFTFKLIHEEKHND